MSDPAPNPQSPPVPVPIRLRPELGQLAALTEFIEDFALRHDLPVADTHAFTLAAEELFANTLAHGQPPATRVEFSLAADEVSASATYQDDAGPFDPTLLPEADTALPADQRKIGGLGIHFIRRTMPEFRYQRAGERNITTFGRPLTRKPHAP